MKRIIFLIAIVSLFSCKEKKQQNLKDKQSQIETGSLDSTSRYTAEEIGWTTVVPTGWKVLTREASKENMEKGKKEIEKKLDVEVDVSSLKQLLNLKKDQFNSFLSTIEPFNDEEAGAYEKTNQKVYAVMKETYAGNGLNAIYTEDRATIDGLSFYVFKVKIYKPDSKETLLNQVMYSRLINGYDFGMTISYNDENALEELEKTVFGSKFSKRE